MKSHINTLKEVTTYLEVLQEKYPNSVLWKMLHIASWSYKINWVFWF
jgi:hypothetical protein